MQTNEILATKISHRIPHHSIGRYDLLPIFSDVELFNEIIDHLIQPFIGRVSCVVALEATGWILGVAMAQKLNVPFIPIRKGGKLPYPKNMVKEVSLVDYSHEEKKLCLKNDAIKEGMKVLIVDEWIETGAQLEAAIQLLKQFPCEIIGACTISIRNEANKTRNLKWIQDGFVHAVGMSIRRFE